MNEVNKELPYDAANEIRTHANFSWTIEENIAYWHDHETGGNELHEFLRVPEDSYNLWMQQKMTDHGLWALMKAGVPENQKLTARRVHEVFNDCLYSKTSDRSIPPKTGDGIMMETAFGQDRLADNAVAIDYLLDELPEVFKEGMSFLQMCFDKRGRQWGEHQNCDELLMLGLARGRLSYLLPRTMWKALPGGMPYIILDAPETETEAISEPVKKK